MLKSWKKSGGWVREGEETRKTGNLITYVAFGAIYSMAIIACIVAIAVHSHNNGKFEDLEPGKATSAPIQASVPLDFIPAEHLMLTSLSLLEEVDIQVATSEGERSMRFSILSASRDPKNNITTMKLSLDQTLIVTPHLSALFDEFDRLVAINLDNQFVEITSQEEWEKTLAKELSQLLRNYLADFGNPGESSSLLDDSQVRARRLGISVYKKSFGKGYGYYNTPASLRAPGFYGSMPYYGAAYPNAYPIYRRPVPPVVAPYMATAPTMIYPQMAQTAVATTTVVSHPNVTAATFVGAPSATPVSSRPSNGGMSAGDLEIIADLLQSSNKQLKEEILDLTFNSQTRRRDPGISESSLAALTKALESNTRAPNAMLDLNYSGHGTQMSQHGNRFQDGYKDGFKDGVSKGEKAATSTWCSIDKSHPLCANNR